MTNVASHVLFFKVSLQINCKINILIKNVSTMWHYCGNFLLNRKISTLFHENVHKHYLHACRIFHVWSCLHVVLNPGSYILLYSTIILKCFFLCFTSKLYITVGLLQKFNSWIRKHIMWKSLCKFCSNEISIYLGGC